MNFFLFLVTVLLVFAKVLGFDEGECLDPAMCRGDAGYDLHIVLLLLSLGQSVLPGLLTCCFRFGHLERGMEQFLGVSPNNNCKV